MMNFSDNVVLFLDGKGSHSQIQQVLDNYFLINDLYINRLGKWFLPINHLSEFKKVIFNNYENTIRYNYPFLTESTIKVELKALEEFYINICQVAPKFSNDFDYPCLINFSREANSYSYYKDSYILDFISWIFDYVMPKHNAVYEDLSEHTPSTQEYDPDEDDEYKSIAWDIQLKVEQLSQVGAYKLMFDTFKTIAKQFGINEIEIDQILNKSKTLNLSEDISQPLSRLRITKDYKIFLTDYQNLEIRMPTLSKVIFIFFLRHPEGILFKEIHNHKKEIQSIYYRITNRLDTESLEQSLEDLLNPFSNSLNEKCSRIKEAFISEIGDM